MRSPDHVAIVEKIIELQLLAPPLAEETLLRAARMYERETDWHRLRAKV